MKTPLVNPWQGMGIVLAVFGGLMLLLKWYQRRFAPHPELARKLFHIGMGLFTLTLPWLFAEPWPVFAMTAVTLGLMLAIRRFQGIRERVGSVMGSVERYSLGEIYFPVSVALLFYFSRDNLVLYSIPILILTFADSTAALIGIRYGMKRYQGIEGQKSAEGSVAFFLVTFFSVHLPLLLLTETGRAESLLIAVILGVLVMLFEAIAWDGLDNFFIPLAAYVLLRFYVPMPARDLLARLLFTLLLGAFVFGYRRHATLDSNGLMGAIIIGYICWWLGGWRWIVPPVILFIGYTLFSPRTEINSRRIHNFHAVLSICGAGLAWLLVYRWGRDEYREIAYAPYLASFGGHLAIAGIARLKFDYPKLTTPTVLVSCISKGWLLMFIAFVAMQGNSRQTWLYGGLMLAGVAAIALLFYALQPQMENCPTDRPRWRRQAVAGMAGSLLTAGAVSLFR